MNDTLNKWIVTDPSTNQQRKQLSDLVFILKEEGKDEATIDVGNYGVAYIENCINAYGYTIFTDNANTYELIGIKRCAGIIAECIYELNF